MDWAGQYYVFSAHASYMVRDMHLLNVEDASPVHMDRGLISNQQLLSSVIFKFWCLCEQEVRASSVGLYERVVGTYCMHAVNLNGSWHHLLMNASK